MKHTFLTLGFLLTFVLAGFAQQQKSSGHTIPADDQVARAATEVLVAKYSLNADQAKQMYAIQARKQRNLAEIESLKTTDPVKYYAKLKSIQQGTIAGIKRTLRTKEQVTLFQRTQSQVRSDQAAKRKVMISEGATQEQVEAAMLDIYAE